MSSRPAGQQGFTLVEVLVAILILSILSTMAWKGIDGLVRARDVAQGQSERIQRAATVISQWERDLSQLQASSVAPPLAFDGAALRMTRRDPDGLRVVVWTLQNYTLYRWASPPVTRVEDLQQAWLRGQQWTAISGTALPMLGEVSQWQIYYYRSGDNTWSNAQSTGGQAAPPPEQQGSSPTPNPGTGTEELPAGLRLVLTLPGGALTRDLLVAPAQ